MTEPAPDTPPDPDDAKPAEPDRRRIVLAVGARTIEVEGPDPLPAIVDTAERMWDLAVRTTEPTIWAGGMGFSAELAPPPDPPMPDEQDTARPAVGS